MSFGARLLTLDETSVMVGDDSYSGKTREKNGKWRIRLMKMGKLIDVGMMGWREEEMSMGGQGQVRTYDICIVCG